MASIPLSSIHNNNDGHLNNTQITTNGVENKTDCTQQLRKLLVRHLSTINKDTDNDIKSESQEKKNDSDLIQLLRQCSLSFLLNVDIFRLMRDQPMFSVFFNLFNENSITDSQALLSTLTKNFLFELQQSNKVIDWKLHQNLTNVLFGLFNHHKVTVNLTKESILQFVDFLVELLITCNYTQILLSTVLCLELLIVKVNRNILIEQIKPIRSALILHAERLSQIKVINQRDAENYQVSWCAHWCLTNVVNVSSSKVKENLEIEQVKLGDDRLEARDSSSYGWSTVRSAFEITSGVFYYEVTLLTGGHMRIGWATWQARFAHDLPVGDSEHSIGVNLAEGTVLHKSHFAEQAHHIQMNPLPVWKAGDVVGCWIDVSKNTFGFTLNGQSIVNPVLEVHFSTQPYFAAVSMVQHQQCSFNFGQRAFCHQTMDATNFHQASNGLVQHYRLMQYSKMSIYYWFKRELIDGKIKPFFFDEVQKRTDQLVRNQIEANYRLNKPVTKLDLKQLECYRFIQSVIDTMRLKLRGRQLDQVSEWIHKLITRDNDDLNYFNNAKLIELIYPYLSLPITPENEVMRHNACIALVMVLKVDNIAFRGLPEHYYGTLYCHMFDFLRNSKLITIHHFFCNSPTMMDALISFDFVKFNSEAKSKLLADTETCSSIWWCAELFGQVDQLARLYDPRCDFVRLQLGFCAAWFRDNVMQRSVERVSTLKSTLNPNDCDEYVKLSSNLLCCRTDMRGWHCVRSICGTTPSTSEEAIFYYEAIVLTDGDMWIGWATAEDRIATPIAGDDHSIAFNGHSQVVLQNKPKKQSVFTKRKWKPGDVIGCLIDHTKAQFQFYLNGRKVNYRKADIVFYVDESYHAYVTLTLHQQCYFNFGQTPFKYVDSVKLKYPLLKSFYQVHDQAESGQYRAMTSVLTSKCYQLVEVLVNQAVSERFYDDPKQLVLDKMAQMLEWTILQAREPQVELADEDECLRMVQSVIEFTGRNLDHSSEKTDVLANWLAHFICHSSSVSVHFPDLVSKLLYPYLSQQLTNQTAHIHRNVCIILSTLVTVIPEFRTRVNLYQQIFIYLRQVILTFEPINDEWIFLFAVIGLENMQLSADEKLTIQHSNKFRKVLQAQCYRTYSSQMYEYEVSVSVQHQSSLCTEWFQDQVLDYPRQTLPTKDQVSLNPQDQSSSYLKLSTDLLCARSDYDSWQSVRTNCDVSKEKNVYFEVTLHTSGPMRIGWALRRTPLHKEPIGGIDGSSIAFDGYNRCVWHRGEQIALIKTKGKPDMSRWKAGDIVGCMIDVKAHRFSFYINRQLIYCHNLGYFAKMHFYHGAISLGTHQQARFNFGPNLELPPIDPDPLSFHSFLRLPDSVSNLFNGITSVKNTVVLINSNMSVGGDLKFTLTEKNIILGNPVSTSTIDTNDTHSNVSILKINSSKS